ncbi:M60 family metallopeptidase, partial [Vibrio owensii]|uniref:M60 family metallopeptidase n=1 Tax=Vibrio owensii TaxID=696485 RepID=UPI00391F2A52
ELMFDGEHSTHMRIAEGTPNYVNIDLGENIDINALVYTPPKEGYSGRIKDFLVYGSSDNEEWRLIASRTIPHGNGNAPHIAFAGEESALQQTQEGFTINIRPRVTLEAERLSNSKRTDVTPTGLYSIDQGTVALWVTNVQDDDFIELADGPWAGSKKYRLKEGLNSFNVNAQSGELPLYLHIASNDTNDRDRKASVRLMASNIARYPIFYNGRTNQKDWENMLVTYPESKKLEMVGENMILDMRRSYYTPVNMQDLSDTYEEVLVPTELAAGISNHDVNPLHYSDANPYIFLASEHGYMAKYDDYLTYNYLSLTHRMITPEEARNFWGIWHEVGHTLQTPGLKWSGQGEVSVNIYAFAARAYNTPLNELVTMYDPEFTKAFNNLT